MQVDNFWSIWTLFAFFGQNRHFCPANISGTAEGNFVIRVSACYDSVALPEIVTPILKYGFLVDLKIYLFFLPLPHSSIKSLHGLVMTSERHSKP